LFTKPYETIDWNAARNQCASEDLYYPHGFFQNSLWWVLYKAENLFQGPLQFLRRKALQEVMKLVAYEDENTRFINIGPVNKVINMLCRWFANPEGEAFKRYAPFMPHHVTV
jgi:cycloartenol synthase